MRRYAPRDLIGPAGTGWPPQAPTCVFVMKRAP
jgi:hypothetical protein